MNERDQNAAAPGYSIAITTPRNREASQVGSMSSNVISRTLVERTVGGKRLSIETGHLAKQASGSVVVRIGDRVYDGSLKTRLVELGNSLLPN